MLYCRATGLGTCAKHFRNKFQAAAVLEVWSTYRQYVQAIWTTIAGRFLSRCSKHIQLCTHIPAVQCYLSERIDLWYERLVIRVYDLVFVAALPENGVIVHLPISADSDCQGAVFAAAAADARLQTFLTHVERKLCYLDLRECTSIAKVFLSSGDIPCSLRGAIWGRFFPSYADKGGAGGDRCLWRNVLPGRRRQAGQHHSAGYGAQIEG